MASSRRIDAFVRRLEQAIARELEGRDRVPLAYSGGLASTLVAMVARKRCALECVVAGVEGSPDVVAAKASKLYLDYRIEHVIVTRDSAARIRARIAAAHPGLSAGDLDNLVPVHAAVERADGRTILSGFGLAPLRTPVVAALGDINVALPIRVASRGTSLTRSTLRRAAVDLGLPVPWARVAHRSPANGAGVRELLRSAERHRE